ncbi:MAG: hypothetical protein M1836_003461 [Candelina mexicana]|nr:MAG: hypothetical protein M1836_003461 [Candelina mexicana]
MRSDLAKRKRDTFEDFDYLAEGIILSYDNATNRKYWVPVQAVQSWEALVRIARECLDEPGLIAVFWGGVEVPMDAWQFCLKRWRRVPDRFCQRALPTCCVRSSRREAMDLNVPTSLAVWKLRRRIFSSLRREGPVDASRLDLIVNLPDSDVDMADLYDVGHYLLEGEGREPFLTAAWR